MTRNLPPDPDNMNDSRASQGTEDVIYVPLTFMA
jgi:hypothetical protein